MSKTPVIFVVDDEEMNLRLVEAMLVPLGYVVTTASNGQEALDRVGGMDPDVILLDVMMPRMDGFEVARRLKAREDTKRVPIVMVTALEGVEDRIQALEAGADDFLTKPVDKTELRARIKSLLVVKAYHDHMLNHQKELESRVKERTMELQNALGRIKMVSFETIQRLSRAAVYKDEGTGSHIKRMSHYCEIIAKSLALDAETVEDILYASPMHDVGKIGIPDRILLKPGKLLPREWEIMKQHTTIGAKILEKSDAAFVRIAEIIAISHHERWDGSGYPQGLKGTAIPLAGRITAVADVFDALTTERPYKKAFPVDTSFDILREGKGAHFDPDIVDAFFAAEQQILAIKQQYRDTDESPLFRFAETTELMDEPIVGSVNGS